ncbi:hypothetical protein ScPMuIL_012122 [Solemya velum]
MSSSYGSRPKGSDGSDFWHRESIAWQYKMSSLYKSRLKFDLLLHITLANLMFFRLLPAITSLFGLPMFDKFRKWNLPAPNAWEYAWFVSVFAAVVGWRSLPRNRTALLKQFMIGTVVFGILPVLYGIMDQMDDLFLYINHRKYKAQIAGYPAVIVWFMFLAITLQLHGFAIYFSAQLLRAWKPRVVEKKKTK